MQALYRAPEKSASGAAEGSQLGNLGECLLIVWASPARPSSSTSRPSRSHGRSETDRSEGDRPGQPGAVLTLIWASPERLSSSTSRLWRSHERSETGGAKETDLGNLGNAYSHLGEPRKAIEFYEQALKISRGDRRPTGRRNPTCSI